MNTRKIRKITVASENDLSCEPYYRRLWLATKNIDIPQREWLNEISNALRDFDGIIVNEYGRRYPIPDVDEVFGDDPDVRWMSYYLKPDHSGKLLPIEAGNSTAFNYSTSTSKSNIHGLVITLRGKQLRYEVVWYMNSKLIM